MNTVTRSRTHIPHYYLTSLSREKKIELIAILTNSLLQEPETLQNNWDDYLCGKWQDDADADEMVERIRSARTANKDTGTRVD